MTLTPEAKRKCINSEYYLLATVARREYGPMSTLASSTHSPIMGFNTRISAAGMQRYHGGTQHSEALRPHQGLLHAFSRVTSIATILTVPIAGASLAVAFCIRITICRVFDKGKWIEQ